MTIGFIGSFVVFIIVLGIFVYYKSIAQPKQFRLPGEHLDKKFKEKVCNEIIAPERFLMKKAIAPFDAIREKEFVKKIDLWEGTTLDSTYFMVQILHRLGHNDFIDDNKEKIRQFTQKKFNREIGGFQINDIEKNDVTIHSTHCAIGILKYLYSYNNNSFYDINTDTNIDTNGFLSFIEDQNVNLDKMKSFLNRCFQENVGGFKEKPEDHFLATISDTASALWIYKRLGWLSELLFEGNDESATFKKVNKFISDMKVCGISKRGNKTISFRNRYGNNEDVFLCSTYYTKRALFELETETKTTNPLSSDATNIGIIEFVLDCQGEDGGFGANPQLASNIIHTKSAMSLLYRKISFDDPNKQAWLEQKRESLKEKTLYYLNNCMYNNVFAFGNKEYYQPNMYAINMALDIYEYLDMNVGKEVENAILVFISTCFKSEDGGAVGYPNDKKFKNPDSISYDYIITEYKRRFKYKQRTKYNKTKATLFLENLNSTSSR